MVEGGQSIIPPRLFASPFFGQISRNLNCIYDNRKCAVNKEIYGCKCMFRSQTTFNCFSFRFIYIYIYIYILLVSFESLSPIVWSSPQAYPLLFGSFEKIVLPPLSEPLQQLPLTFRSTICTHKSCTPHIPVHSYTKLYLGYKFIYNTNKNKQKCIGFMF